MGADLSTTYLGLELSSPLVPGASPLADEIDTVRELEDVGAPCIVMRSLFEEQLTREQLATHTHLDDHSGASAEARSYMPDPEYTLGPDSYLEQIRKIREAVDIPVIGSLNGSTPGGWIEHARLIEQAGAQALELNLYAVPVDPERGAAALEAEELEIVRAVRAAVGIPIAVKLSAQYTALPAFVRALERERVDGIVLFNRLFQVDIDPETYGLDRSLHLSTSAELPLRLRWTAILSPWTTASLAVSGGVWSSECVVKAIMAGATAVQCVSVILRNGPKALRTLREGLATWLDEHEYSSVTELRGCMNRARCPDPTAYERANYIHLLTSWHGD
jgi:dihydroorotate dehydrogenase (fumarate)